jgi:hypothetical protein
VRYEVVRALLGEEHLGAVDLDHLADARDQVAQIVRPLDAERRTMDDGRTLGAMRMMLQAVSDSGRLASELVVPFAHMILAALDEITLVIARAADPAAAVAEGRAAVEEMLRRLLRP